MNTNSTFAVTEYGEVCAGIFPLAEPGRGGAPHEGPLELQRPGRDPRLCRRPGARRNVCEEE